MDWGVEKDKIVQTGNRFFKDYKHFSNKVEKKDKLLIDFQIKYLIVKDDVKYGYVKSDQKTIGMYHSNLSNYYADIVNSKKGIIFFNNDFFYGLIGSNQITEDTVFYLIYLD